MRPFTTRYGQVTPIGYATVIGTMILLIGLYASYLADNATGADAARWSRVGCPEGYVPAQVSGIANGQYVLMTQCVPQVKP